MGATEVAAMETDTAADVPPTPPAIRLPALPSTAAVIKAAYPYLRHLMACYMFLMTYVRAFGLFLAAYVPSHVWSVDYIHPATHSVTAVYRASRFWSDRHATICNTMQSGVYAICLWNKKAKAYEYYLLNATHLTAALGVACETTLMAFTGAGLASYLERYMWKHGKTAANIFDISIGDEPAMPAIKPVLASLTLPNNVTAAHLAMWYLHTSRPCRGKLDVVAPCKVVVSDMDLNDKTLGADDYVA